MLTYVILYYDFVNSGADLVASIVGSSGMKRELEKEEGDEESAGRAKRLKVEGEQEEQAEEPENITVKEDKWVTKLIIFVNYVCLLRCYITFISTELF